VNAGWSVQAADPSQRPDQPDVPDGVRELRPPPGLQIRQQIELATVKRAVTRHAAQRHHAQRLPAPAERPGNEMRGVDAGLGAAYDARPAGDGGALRLTRCHRVCSLQRRSAP
jgi:hypothetical protein